MQSSAHKPRPTFAAVCGMDPRIRDLEAEVRAYVASVRRKRVRCANAAWYGYGDREGKGFRSRVVRLVGWERLPAGFTPAVLAVPSAVPLYREPNGDLSDPRLTWYAHKKLRTERELQGLA